MIKLYGVHGKRVYPIIDTGFFQYPAGEWDMKSEPDTFAGTQIAVITGKVDPVDYFKMNLWARTVRSNGGTPHLITPYLPGARGDRGMTENASIFADMINNAFVELHAVDVHSEITEAMYYRLTNHSALRADLELYTGYDGIIAPDKGAVGRATDFAAEYKLPVLLAEKERDFKSGKLKGFKVPENMESHASYLLVDDICDGGGTFIGLADQMRQEGFQGDVDLFVTHGIFSKGVSLLRRSFSEIYTTDSMGPVVLDLDNVVVFPVVDNIIKYITEHRN